jgi:hypothetical protein
MASDETFFLQPFTTHRKRLVPGQRVLARTKHHALDDVERLARTAEGVAVIYFTADDDTGEVSALAALARHGAITGRIRGTDQVALRTSIHAKAD